MEEKMLIRRKRTKLDICISISLMLGFPGVVMSIWFLVAFFMSEDLTMKIMSLFIIIYPIIVAISVWLANKLFKQQKYKKATFYSLLPIVYAATLILILLVGFIMFTESIQKF